MDQVYKVVYSGVGGAPPVRNARPAIIVPAGKLISEAVPFMGQGFLTQMSIQQTGGTNVAAKVDLLESEAPFPPGIYDDEAVPTDNIANYRILPQQSVAADGAAVEVFSNHNGYPFINQDGGYADNKRFLYLIITPTSSAEETSWDVTIKAYRNM